MPPGRIGKCGDVTYAEYWPSELYAGVVTTQDQLRASANTSMQLTSKVQIAEQTTEESA
jgi:hypothetical protein